MGWNITFTSNRDFLRLQQLRPEASGCLSWYHEATPGPSLSEETCQRPVPVLTLHPENPPPSLVSGCESVCASVPGAAALLTVCPWSRGLFHAAGVVDFGHWRGPCPCSTLSRVLATCAGHARWLCSPAGLVSAHDTRACARGGRLRWARAASGRSRPGPAEAAVPGSAAVGCHPRCGRGGVAPRPARPALRLWKVSRVLDLMVPETSGTCRYTHLGQVGCCCGCSQARVVCTPPGRARFVGSMLM